MHTGSCLCGAVRYEIRGDIGPGFYCHCSRCRKAGGSAFASNAVVAADDFVVTAGADALKTFVADTGLHRSFCANCGSPIISRREGVRRCACGWARWIRRWGRGRRHISMWTRRRTGGRSAMTSRSTPRRRRGPGERREAPAFRCNPARVDLLRTVPNHCHLRGDRRVRPTQDPGGPRQSAGRACDMSTTTAHR